LATKTATPVRSDSFLGHHQPSPGNHGAVGGGGGGVAALGGGIVTADLRNETTTAQAAGRRSASVSDLSLHAPGFGSRHGGLITQRSPHGTRPRGFITPTTERRQSASKALPPRGSMSARPSSAKPTVHDLRTMHKENERRARRAPLV
jgi:hypothetical protein